jgi:hypothetical protein
MNASASTAARCAAAPPPPRFDLAGQAGNVPLTRVALAYIEPRFKLYLRFGEPARTLQLDRWRRCAVFLPGAVLPHPLAGQRLRHDPLAAHGDAGLHAAGRRAAHPRRAAGRAPAAARRRRCQRARRAGTHRRHRGAGHRAIDVSPAYWRTLGNRLAARLRCPNTPPSGTPPGWPGGRCHDHDFHHRPRAASSLAPARSHRAGGLAAVGLAALAWAASCIRCRA